MKKPEINEQQPIKVYTSITDLPLSNFIDVIVDGNYARLIKSGHPTEIEVKEAWVKIMSQYSDALGGSESKVWLNLLKDITILELTLTQITGLIEILQKVYYQPFCEMLNKLLRTNYKFDPKNSDEYQRLLKACLSRSKGIKIDLDLKRLKIKGLEEKAQNEATPYTHEYFQTLLVVISDHAKFHITTDITVFEFITRIKRFNAYCEEMRKHYTP